MSQAKKQHGLKEILKVVKAPISPKPKSLDDDELIWFLSKDKIKAVIRKQKEQKKTNAKKSKDDEDLEIKVKDSKPKKKFNLYTSVVDNFYFMEQMYGQVQCADYSKLYSHMGNASLSAQQGAYEAAVVARGDNLGEKEIISEKEIESCIVGYACVRIFSANETDMSIDMRERFKYWKELNKWKLEMKMRYTASWA